MDRVIFKTEDEKNVFIITKKDMPNVIIPLVGHRITIHKTYMFVTAVEHDYDSNSIIVTVKVM